MTSALCKSRVVLVVKAAVVARAVVRQVASPIL